MQFLTPHTTSDSLRTGPGVRLIWDIIPHSTWPLPSGISLHCWSEHSSSTLQQSPEDSPMYGVCYADSIAYCLNVCPLQDIISSLSKTAGSYLTLHSWYLANSRCSVNVNFKISLLGRLRDLLPGDDKQEGHPLGQVRKFWPEHHFVFLGIPIRTLSFPILGIIQTLQVPAGQ